MINLAWVKNTLVKSTIRYIKVLRNGKNDVQVVQLASPFGDDSNPCTKDMLAVYARTTDAGEPVIIGFVQKSALAAVGEKRIFSTDASGNLVSYIWLHNAAGNGQIELGGTADNAVLYSQLAAAFNQLKNDLNALVTKFNAHQHTAPGGATTGNTMPASSSSADISGAKNEKIKTIA